MRITILSTIVVVLLFAGCDREDDKFAAVEPVTAPAAGKSTTASTAGQEQLPEGHPPISDSAAPVPKPTTVTYNSPEEYGKTGPLRWTTPDDWQAAKPASSMRLAEYLIPGKPEAAVMSIFYFGPAGGGGVDANVSRWVGQFDDGKAQANTEVKTVNGLKVHTVDASGTYNPGMAGGNSPPQKDYRMLGAIVESSAGLFFFKLVGPASVVAESQEGWNSFVDSFSGG